MSFFNYVQVWEQLAQEDSCKSLAQDLLSVRGTSMWLELLVDHPELLGSQLYFNKDLHRFMLIQDYAPEHRRHACLSLIFLAEAQPNHQLCHQLDWGEVVGLLFQSLSFKCFIVRARSAP